MERDADGGFRVTDSEGPAWVATPATAGWSVRAPRDGRSFTLRCEAASFVVCETGGQGESSPVREVARTLRWEETGGLVDGVFLLDEGGRLFHIQAVAGSVRFELRGWEVPGAYWHADLEGVVWRIDRTPAGRDLPNAFELLLVFAAELSRIAEP